MATALVTRGTCAAVAFADQGGSSGDDSSAGNDGGFGGRRLGAVSSAAVQSAATAAGKAAAEMANSTRDAAAAVAVQAVLARRASERRVTSGFGAQPSKVTLEGTVNRTDGAPMASGQGYFDLRALSALGEVRCPEGFAMQELAVSGAGCRDEPLGDPLSAGASPRRMLRFVVRCVRLGAAAGEQAIARVAPPTPMGGRRHVRPAYLAHTPCAPVQQGSRTDEPLTAHAVVCSSTHVLSSLRFGADGCDAVAGGDAGGEHPPLRPSGGSSEMRYTFECVPGAARAQPRGPSSVSRDASIVSKLI